MQSARAGGLAEAEKEKVEEEEKEKEKGEIEKEEKVIEEKEGGEKEEEKEKEKEEEKEEEKEVCKHWRRRGQCSFGDRCRFLHPSDLVPLELPQSKPLGTSSS